MPVCQDWQAQVHINFASDDENLTGQLSPEDFTISSNKHDKN